MTHSFEDVTIMYTGPITHENPFSRFKMLMRRSRAPFSDYFATHSHFDFLHSCIHIWRSETGINVRSLVVPQSYGSAKPIVLFLPRQRLAIFTSQLFIVEIASGKTLETIPLANQVLHSFWIEDRMMTIDIAGKLESWPNMKPKYLYTCKETIEQAIQVSEYLIIRTKNATTKVNTIICINALSASHYQVETGNIECIGSAGAEKFITISDKHKCTVYSARSGVEIKSTIIDQFDIRITSAEYVGGETVAITYARNLDEYTWGSEVYLYDIETLRQVKRVNILQKAKTLRYLGGEYMMHIGTTGIVFIVDLTNGRCVQKLRGGPYDGKNNIVATFSPERTTWQVNDCDIRPNHGVLVSVPKGNHPDRAPVETESGCTIC